MNSKLTHPKFIIRGKWVAFFLFAILLVGQAPSFLSQPEKTTGSQELCFRAYEGSGTGESLVPDHFARHFQTRQDNLFIRDFGLHIFIKTAGANNFKQVIFSDALHVSSAAIYLALQVFRI